MLFLVDPHVIALPTGDQPAKQLVSYVEGLSRWSDIFKEKRDAVLSEKCAVAIQKAGCLPDLARLRALWYEYGDGTIGLKDVLGSINSLLINTPYLEDRIPIIRQIDVDEESVTALPDLFGRVVEPLRKPFKYTVGCIAYVQYQEVEAEAVSIITHPVDASTSAHVNAFVESISGSQPLEAHISLRTSPEALDDRDVDSWTSFIAAMKKRYKHLTFCAFVVEQITDPFDEIVAEAADHLLGVLDELSQCFDESGGWTARGIALYQKYFVGDKAKFSNESDTNKSEFASDLTFKIGKNQRLFCPFHGKINRRVYRLHFSWPIRAGEPLYIVYLGPKITKD